MSIEVLPLGAGQDVGRSCCIVRMAGRTVMFDCGAHFGFRDERRFPEFGLLSRAGRFTEIIDALVITHFHTDHLGALPYFTEICGYRGPILMTYPTFAIAPIMLEDYVKVNADRPGDRLPYNEQHVRDCLRRVTAVDLHQVVTVSPGLSFTFHYAGHVLGAAMVHMTAGHLTALYTGDFNSSPDRHLGQAEPPTPPGGPSGAPLRSPDVLISEATYAASLRDSKRARERDLLGAVVETVAAGGKVLIPTFAMGRAQELLMLITDCWERNGLQVPIYFSSAMASRALVYYQLLLNWTNANVRRTIFGAATPTAPPTAAARCRFEYYQPYEEPSDGGGCGSSRGGGGGDGEMEADGTAAGPPPYDADVAEYGSDSDDDEQDRDPDGGDVGAEGGHRRRRRQPLLPVDIARHDSRRAAAGAAADVTGGGVDAGGRGAGVGGVGSGVGGPGGGPGGGGAGGFTKGTGVFSEADVYGMFRTRPWDRSLLHAPGPALLFASPGNITSGVSLEAFRAWAGSPRNLLVLAGYQVRGTLGARLEAIQNQGLQQQQQQQAAGGGGVSGGGAQKAAAAVDVPGGGGGGGGPGGSGGRVEVRCRIKMLAFSAHADLRGLLGLVRRVAPRSVVLVHGQREPMEFMRGRIESTLGIECHAPPTGTTVVIAPRRAVPLGVRPQLVTAAGCAAGIRAAEAADAAVRVGPAAVSPRPGPGEGSSFNRRELEAELLQWRRRLRPQPLTALPLSGVVVARVVAASHQLPPGGPPPSSGGNGGGGGGGGAATQLTLTDSTTAARVLLQAHQASHGTAVMPYKITYGCTIAVQLPGAALAGAGARTLPGPAGEPEAWGGGGGADRLEVAAVPAGTAAAAAAAAAALARARAAVCAAVGGYAANRQLRVDDEAMSLCFGSFRAQLSVDSLDPDSSDLNSKGGSADAVNAPAAASVHEGQQQQEDVTEADAGGGGSGGAAGASVGRALPRLRISCEWSAAEDAAACRCLQALRAEFGEAGS